VCVYTHVLDTTTRCNTVLQPQDSQALHIYAHIHRYTPANAYMMKMHLHVSNTRAERHICDRLYMRGWMYEYRLAEQTHCSYTYKMVSFAEEPHANGAFWQKMTLQGGKADSSPLCCRSHSEKEPMITGSFAENDVPDKGDQTMSASLSTLRG